MLIPSVFAVVGTHTVPFTRIRSTDNLLPQAGRWCACLPCSRIKARPDTALAAVVASCCAYASQPVPPKSRPIEHDGYRLIAQREGSHATPSASAATSLSGHFKISV
jgi:hypothetical protein